MHIRRISTTINDLALLGKCRFLCYVIGSVQIDKALGDNYSFCIRPRAVSDPVASVYSIGSLIT